jgi:Na+-translocating ferredoxin:NAD+ oxidoreductase subunit G
MSAIVPAIAPAGNGSNAGKMIRLMGSVSLICGVLIVGTYRGTKEPIKRNQETILQETIGQLLPGVQKQVIYGVKPDGELAVLDSADGNGARFFAGFDGSGKLLGLVLEGNERGYADNIKAMYTYSPEKEAIVELKVVEVKETPGLGDKIVTDKGFLSNFKNLEAKLDAAKAALAHPIVAVKHGTKKNPWEVDAISGATISSRAIGRLLNKSTQQILPVIQRNMGRIQKGE